MSIIEEVRVGFDNAKLLKEKSFEVSCNKLWCGEFGHKFKIKTLNTKMSNSYYIKLAKEKLNPEINDYCIAPTQQVAIDWIRINFGIQIFLDYTFYDGFHYGCKIVLPNGDVEEIWVEGVDNDIDGSSTPEEAKEAAINHVLTILI
jgi:hypothetical protein